MTPAEAAAIAHLRRPQTIRDRCELLFAQAEADQLSHFACDLTRLDAVADLVIDTTRQHYPDFEVPFHSRWRHFDAGGVPRLARLDRALADMNPDAAARAKLDLAVVSVLLDAGAGTAWRYHDREADQVIGRSEGLAIASFQAFLAGQFSSDPDAPLRVDAVGLQRLTEADLAACFQVSDLNPLVGLAGRLAVLHRLGDALQAQPDRFGTHPARPSGLLDRLRHRYGSSVDAGDLLVEVLTGLGEIWPGRRAIAGVSLGDVWPHPALPRDDLGQNLVPFHKLSQWLTYSLVEPLMAAGVGVINLNALTGLAEYRNGGLCIDMGLLVPKHSRVLGTVHAPSDEVVVEWRALTLVLLDRIGDRVCAKLGKSPVELPLIKVLEGGTWAAGRRIAKQYRESGAPPLAIASDGTVF